ncbi:MAG: phosphotransferase [Chloroflexi bacterium]|nr:phosphotransferase [Chloroflexota bacterium]
MDHQFEASIQIIVPGGHLRRAWALPGGVSAHVTALEVQTANGATQTYVVRQHHRDRVAKEAQILQLLQSQRVPVPRLYHTQLAEPAFLIEAFIDGEPNFDPDNIDAYVITMAHSLAQIHTVDVRTVDLSFAPLIADFCTQKLDNPPEHFHERLHEREVRAALQAHQHVVTHNAAVLLHGDFWPGNVLWRGDQVQAVIDWEDAALGDPLADVANSRREMLWFFGRDAMQRFTEAYRAQMPHIDYTHLPYWDLCMGLRPVGQMSSWCLDAAKKARFEERYRWFVQAAITQLSRRNAAHHEDFTHP